jgi:transposase
MGKPHPIELRTRVQAEIDAGESRRAAAERFKVSASFAVKLAARVARTGSAEPGRQGRPSGGGKLAPHLAALIGWVEAEPDMTMPELAEKLLAEKDVAAHPASLSRVLIQAGFSFKKTLLASETERADVKEARHDWTTSRQPRMREDVHRLVFLDETGTTTKMTRLRGPRSHRRTRQSQSALRPLGNADLHRRLALRRSDRALGRRQTHEPCDL